MKIIKGSLMDNIITPNMADEQLLGRAQNHDVAVLELPVAVVQL